MYEKGDLIIYGKQSVCKVENVGLINIGRQVNEREYYTLIPYFMDGKTYVPVDTPIFMRHLINPDEVNGLIKEISNMEANIFEHQTTNQLTEYYNNIINGYTCKDLLQMICNIFAKQKVMESSGKKLVQTDIRYKKEAEDLLYQEFAIVLGVPKEDVMKRVHASMMQIV